MRPIRPSIKAADPLPMLEVLSQDTGIPLPCLIRYVLVKYAASGAVGDEADRPPAGRKGKPLRFSIPPAGQSG